MATDNVIYAVDLTNRNVGWSRGPDTPPTGSWNDWPVGGPGQGACTFHWISSSGVVLANTTVTLSTLQHVKTRTTQTTGVWITTDNVRQATVCRAAATASSGATRTALNALATVIDTNVTIPKVG